MVVSYIYREFTPHPRKLPRIRSYLPDAARMRLPHIHSISPQSIDDLQVLLEHIRVLVIFGGDVLLDGSGKGEAVGLAEGQEEDIAGVR